MSVISACHLSSALTPHFQGCFVMHYFCRVCPRPLCHFYSLPLERCDALVWRRPCRAITRPGEVIRPRNIRRGVNKLFWITRCLSYNTHMLSHRCLAINSHDVSVVEGAKNRYTIQNSFTTDWRAVRELWYAAAPQPLFKYAALFVQLSYVFICWFWWII